jgi:hypothetical protein
MALFPVKRVRNVADYVAVLSRFRRQRILWFRGQTNARRKLIPGLARRGKNWLSNEPMLTTRFRKDAQPLIPFGSRPESDWAWLLLMQHYGVPTRLLDWTENPLAGLYFAVVSMSGRNTSATDGCVYVLDPVALNGEANLAGASDAIPTLDVDIALREYLPGEVATAVNVRPPVAVLAMRMFPRLVAQSGVFTVIHRNPTPIEDIHESKYVGQIVIPRSAKPLITRQLSKMGVTRLSLFPELESVAIHVKSFLK